jgi:hypothetical protein
MLCPEIETTNTIKMHNLHSFMHMRITGNGPKTSRIELGISFVREDTHSRLQEETRAHGNDLFCQPSEVKHVTSLTLRTTHRCIYSNKIAQSCLDPRQIHGEAMVSRFLMAASHYLETVR